MFDYISNELYDQCQMNMSGGHLIYAVLLNGIFIFIPTISLFILNAIIIFQSYEFYKLIANLSMIDEFEGKYFNSQAEAEAAAIIAAQTADNNEEINLSILNDDKTTTTTTKTGKNSFSNSQISASLLINHKKKSKNRPSCLNEQQQSDRSQRIRFTIIISSMALAFFFCQLPIRIFQTWSYFHEYFNPIFIYNSTINISNDSISEYNPNYDNYNYNAHKNHNHINNNPSFFNNNLNPISLNDVNFNSYDNNTTGSVVSETEDYLYGIYIIKNITSIIFYFHTVSNPIIYNLASKKFRSAFFDYKCRNRRHQLSELCNIN
jgi:hypothetical protein